MTRAARSVATTASPTASSSWLATRVSDEPSGDTKRMSPLIAPPGGSTVGRPLLDVSVWPQKPYRPPFGGMDARVAQKCPLWGIDQLTRAIAARHDHGDEGSTDGIG